MEYRKFKDTYVLRLQRGEELVSSIKEFCLKEDVKLGSIEGLGAADYLKVGLYDVGKQVYHSHEFSEPLEITSLTGNISTMNGEVYLHIHINVADEKMNVHGGHLNECRISATCELFIRKLEGTVEREKDPETGLNLYKFL